MVEGRGYCCIGLLPFLVAILAIFASGISTGWCETIQFSPNLNKVPEGTNLTAQTQDILSNSDGFAKLQFGLFYLKKVQDFEFDSVRSSYVDVRDSCIDYDSGVDIDVSWRIARTFAIVAPLTGVVLALALLVSPCIIFFTKRTWTRMAILFMTLIPAFQGLTLLVLTSDLCKDNPVIEERFDKAIAVLSGGGDSASNGASNSTNADNSTSTNESTSHDSNGVDEDVLKSIYEGECEWDWGIYAQLVSMILFFLTGVVMLIMGAPVRPEPKEPEEQIVTYEQNTGENGETTVEEIQVDVHSNQTGIAANSELPPWSKLNQQNNGQLEQAQPY